MNNLEEALDDEDWDSVQHSVDHIRETLENPFDNYNTEAW